MDDKYLALFQPQSQQQSLGHIRIAPEAHIRFMSIARENNYGPRQFTRFMNDLAQMDMYSDPTKLHLRILVSIGKLYKLSLSHASVQSLNDVALSSGLPKDPSVVFNNIYSGYIEPIVYPNALQSLIDAGIPIPEPEYDFDTEEPVGTYHSSKKTVFLSLTPAALLQFTQDSITALAYGNYTFLDTRPDNIRKEHEAQSTLHLPQKWAILHNEKMQTYLRLEPFVISTLADIALTQFNITGGVRQKTENSLVATLLNAIAEGWITVQS